MADTLKRSYLASLEIGSIHVDVDSIDKNTITFYWGYDSILLPGSGKMLLPMATIAQLFKDDRVQELDYILSSYYKIKRLCQVAFLILMS